MPRRIFWRDAASRVDNTSGMPIPNANVTAWTRRTGGTQHTDLRAVDDDGVIGAAISGGILVTDAGGYLPSFAGPNDGTSQLWLDAGGSVGRVMVSAESPVNAGDNTTLVAGDGSLIPTSTFAGAVHSHSVADLPAGSVLHKLCNAGVWPVRGTTRADLLVIWIKTAVSDPDPAINSTYMLSGVDILLRRT